MTTKPPLTPKKRPSPRPQQAVVWSHEGWGRPAGSSLRHYIRGQRSLCREWGYYGDVRTDASAAEQCELCLARLASGTLPEN